LNEVAWNFFEKVNNKSLEIAVQWAAQSVKRNEEYANMDTLANLYMKIGDKVNAKKWAEKAIEKATQDGEDATSTRELLNKL
jgi:TPR repeat protein